MSEMTAIESAPPETQQIEPAEPAERAPEPPRAAQPEVSAEGRGDEGERPNLTAELVQLVHLAGKYPEIAQPVAELAFKTGYPEHGRQVLEVATGGQAPGLIYHAIGAKYAKQAGRAEEVFRYALAGLSAFAADPDRYTDPDDGPKLLHLLRLGFTTLLFEMKDVNGYPPFIDALLAELPKLSARLDTDPFFHTLYAQALWYRDKEASEREWDRAAELSEPEFTYNARGTWYKEAERDPAKAELAYRQGLVKVPRSPLLSHNLAQILLDRALAEKERSPAEARRLVEEADGLVRVALQGDCPKGLRRHIHHTRAEIADLRAVLHGRRRAREAPAEESAPPSEEERQRRREEQRKAQEEKVAQLQVGQVVRGHVRSLADYGAFVKLDMGVSGLLHKSAMVQKEGQPLEVGQEVEVKIIDIAHLPDGRPRIGLSQRALLSDSEPARERPPREERKERERREPRNRPEGRRPRPAGEPAGERRAKPERPERGGRPSQEKLASLGEMLLAKLKGQETK